MYIYICVVNTIETHLHGGDFRRLVLPGIDVIAPMLPTCHLRPAAMLVFANCPTKRLRETSICFDLF